MPKATRQEVYAAIDDERAYQDSLSPNRIGNGANTVGDYLVLLQTYIRQAFTEWTFSPSNERALNVVRKIGAISVHCMEAHGAAQRPKNETQGQSENKNQQAVVEADLQTEGQTPGR